MGVDGSADPERGSHDPRRVDGDGAAVRTQSTGEVERRCAEPGPEIDHHVAGLGVEELRRRSVNG